MKEIYEKIKKEILLCQTDSVEINSKFHHNCNYKDIVSVINNGILSYQDVRKVKGFNLTEREKEILSDDCHVNGYKSISLSSLDIDYSRISDKEMLYEPDISYLVDIQVSGNIKARRNSTNYANEYLCDSRIDQSLFESIDVRLLKYMEDRYTKVEQTIEYYKYLRELAIALKDNKLNIPLREMSYGNVTLDVDKVKSLPRL